MKVLNELGEELSYQFFRDLDGRGCTCFISPPCGYCTHPGHPTELEYTDDVWAEVWDLDEAVAAAQAAVAEVIESAAARHYLEMAMRNTP